MTLADIVLTAFAVTIAAPAISHAQAARPGMPTTSAPALAQESRRDDDVCGVKMLRGTYVFAATGFNIVAGVALPKAIVEVIAFHGDGTLSVPAVTLSVNGVFPPQSPSIGTYAVEDDCSGNIRFAGPAFDIFIRKDAETIWMIQTNANTVFQGTATRISRGRDQR